MKKIFKSKYLKYSILLLAGLFLGWMLFHPSGKKSVGVTEIKQATADEHGTIWTCAMHPQIRMDHPGKCPICGMDLIPLGQADTSAADPGDVRLSRDAAALANVLTTIVSKQKPVKEIRLYGKVQADERLIQSQVAHVPGRIDKLAVNFTGEMVRSGQVLAEIYSPELITAEQELLETVKTQLQPDLYEASRERLRQWMLTDAQINQIESSGKTMSNLKVLSNTSGTVISRMVNEGDHVSAGTVLYEIADLSKVWILFDAYESDLPFLSTGKKINFTLQALPGSEFSGNIAFIDPVIDPVTRVAKVRVEASNISGKLKPEMFASGIVSSDLSGYGNDIVIPRSAVLWTGKRSIVYVKQPGTEPVFRMREIELGPALGNSYVIMDGLKEGEEIVTSGTFSVDASAQLEGKPSMMNPEGGATNTMPGMDMTGTNMQNKGEKAGTDSGVNMDFKMQLNAVSDSYIAVKNALVNSNMGAAAKEAENLLAALSKTDMKLLSGDNHTKWMGFLDKMKKSAAAISASKSILDQRTAFADLSVHLCNSVKTFGLMGKTLYYQFCPMFRNGSYWLSETEEIKNPFYGNDMLTCGETKEVLRY